VHFPADFVWGAATSAYQIEGAALQDGKKASVWDMYCRKPGTIRSGEDGVTACDHYHRFREDVRLMKEIGLQAYRLSLSWPRLLPDGTGGLNPRGVGFYDALIDELLTAGIQPYVTLFHWDYPYELYLRGGWLHPASPHWFAEYTHAVVAALSDRVRTWMTINEPQCFIGDGHFRGGDAPGDMLGLQEALTAAHHVLLAHGEAVQVIRAEAKTVPRVGCAPVGITYIPASSQPDDIEAARQQMFAVRSKDFWNNTWWCDPLVLGKYPEDGLSLFGEAAPKVRSGDMDLIAQPLDFYGVNFYHGQFVCAQADGQTNVLAFPAGHPYTSMPWPVTPEALYWGPRFLWERYQLPILIAENGIANPDWVALDGGVHDPQRIDFTARYLRALDRAIADGVPVMGYFHWSLMDNFEWACGYLMRFGLIHLDYGTQLRTLKDSARWYRDVIATNGESLEPE
jgi:beta-glucosidase